MAFKADTSRTSDTHDVFRHKMPRCFKCFAQGCCHVDEVEVCSSCLDNPAKGLRVAAQNLPIEMNDNLLVVDQLLVW